jgi:hypothetical protein
MQCRLARIYTINEKGILVNWAITNEVGSTDLFQGGVGEVSGSLAYTVFAFFNRKLIKT